MSTDIIFVLLFLLFILFCTIIAELPVAFFGSMGKKRGLWLVGSILANVATNPLLNIILIALDLFLFRPNFGPRSVLYFVTLAIFEIAVIVAEVFIYRAVTGARFLKCILVSLTANALSFVIGFIVFF